MFLQNLLRNQRANTRRKAKGSEFLKRTPRFENLESRQLMTTGLSVILAHGVLDIQGTSGDDTIIVRQVGKTLEIDGVRETYSVQSVNRIEINSGKGNDVIRLDGNGSSNDQTGSFDLKKTGIGERPIGQPPGPVEVSAYINAGDGNDVVFGGAGDDVIFGGVGNDRIDGGAGNDRIYDLVGNNVLAGGSGNDVINLVAESQSALVKKDVEIATLDAMNRFGLTEDQLQLVSATPMNFPSPLAPGRSMLDVVTPGFVVTLAGPHDRFEYDVDNMGGMQFRRVDPGVNATQEAYLQPYIQQAELDAMNRFDLDPKDNALSLLGTEKTSTVVTTPDGNTTPQYRLLINSPYGVLNYNTMPDGTVRFLDAFAN